MNNLIRKKPIKIKLIENETLTDRFLDPKTHKSVVFIEINRAVSEKSILYIPTRMAHSIV